MVMTCVQPPLHVVHIMQFSVQKSHSVTFEKTAWCYNYILFNVVQVQYLNGTRDKWCHQLLAQGPQDSVHGVLYLIMNDTFVKNNLYNNYDYSKDPPLWQRFSIVY